MKNFQVNKIDVDGYERWAHVIMDNSKEEICVHFLEYDEYLDNNCISSKTKIGDIIEGNLSITLVAEFQIVNDVKKGYWQKINNSSNITAIVKVKEILDSDIVKCEIEGLGDDILVEFESDVDVEVDALIKLEGSLELELERFNV